MKKTGKLIMAATDKVFPNPFQPRKVFDETGIQSLADSIAQNGLLQPISVCKTGNVYMLIAGERRLRAFKLLGYPQIPAILCKADERQGAFLGLVENLQREDLNCFETAASMKELLTNFGLTQEQLAGQLGIAQSTLANKLRLLQLNEQLQLQILQNSLTERHARALLALPEEKRQKALDHIVKYKLNVAESEDYIASLCVTKNKKGKVSGNIKDIRIFINTLNHAVEMMKKAGVQAVTTQDKKEDRIELKIVIPVK